MKDITKALEEAKFLGLKGIYLELTKENINYLKLEGCESFGFKQDINDSIILLDDTYEYVTLMLQNVDDYLLFTIPKTPSTTETKPVKITQKDWVIKTIINNKFITRNMCLRNYISRLGALIPKIEDELLVEFQGKFIPVTTSWGKSKDYQYTLVHEEDMSKLIDYYNKKYDV